MKITAKLFALSFFVATIATAFTTQAEDSSPKTTAAAQWNDKDELLQPVNYREWIFVGTPLTPNDMNDGKAAFPEFHNVYIDPTSWAEYKKTGKFPEGTVMVKELVSVGSKLAASGAGYFQGEFIGLEGTRQLGILQLYSIRQRTCQNNLHHSAPVMQRLPSSKCKTGLCLHAILPGTSC